MSLFHLCVQCHIYIEFCDIIPLVSMQMTAMTYLNATVSGLVFRYWGNVAYVDVDERKTK